MCYAISCFRNPIQGHITWGPQIGDPNFVLGIYLLLILFPTAFLEFPVRGADINPVTHRPRRSSSCIESLGKLNKYHCAWNKPRPSKDSQSIPIIFHLEHCRPKLSERK